MKYICDAPGGAGSPSPLPGMDLFAWHLKEGRPTSSSPIARLENPSPTNCRARRS